LLVPFVALVLDFGDRNHLFRFLSFSFVAAGLAITGKFLATVLHALLIYIESPAQPLLTLDTQADQELRAHFHAGGKDQDTPASGQHPRR
jgi:hypothetical protein